MSAGLGDQDKHCQAFGGMLDYGRSDDGPELPQGFFCNSQRGTKTTHPPPHQVANTTWSSPMRTFASTLSTNSEDGLQRSTPTALEHLMSMAGHVLVTAIATILGA